MAKIKGLSISDLHFGIKDSERLYDELINVFIPQIDPLDANDIVQIHGDYFDRKLSLNESAAIKAMHFMGLLVAKCAERSIKIRIILGTKSHDMDQLANFTHYINRTDIDFKMYYTVTEEVINGVDFLFVPEEYMPDHREYYAKWLKGDKKYTMSSHCAWDFCSFDNQIAESERHSKSAPVFIYDEWKDILHFAICGHIHTRQKFGTSEKGNGVVWYCGSFTRWHFGEPRTKGFIKWVFDTETEEYDVQWIDNTLAPEYSDVKVTDMLNEESTIEDIAEIVIQVKSKLESGELSNIRLNLDGLSDSHQQLIKKSMGSIPDVKIKLKANKNFNQDKDYTAFEYLEDEALTLEQKIQKYIKDLKDVDLPISIIGNLIKNNQ